MVDTSSWLVSTKSVVVVSSVCSTDSVVVESSVVGSPVSSVVSVHSAVLEPAVVNSSVSNVLSTSSVVLDSSVVAVMVSSSVAPPDDRLAVVVAAVSVVLVHDVHLTRKLSLEDLGGTDAVRPGDVLSCFGKAETPSSLIVCILDIARLLVGVALVVDFENIAAFVEAADVVVVQFSSTLRQSEFCWSPSSSNWAAAFGVCSSAISSSSTPSSSFP